MASIKQIKKNAKIAREEIYYTTIGSIVLSFAIMYEKTEQEARKVYSNLKRRKKSLDGKSIIELSDLVYELYGKPNPIELRSWLALFWDKNNIRRPLVAPINPIDNTILPLKKNGEYTGILVSAAEGKNYIEYEYLYNEDGGIIEEEEE